MSLPDDVFPFAPTPIGYPLANHGPLARRPVSDFGFADRWGEAWTARRVSSVGQDKGHPY